MPAQPTPAAQLASKARTPFPGATAEYDRARAALLAEEIEFRRHMTRLVEQRRALPPGPEISKNYRFKDEQGFEVGLPDLFGDKDTLVTYFWMYGPQRPRPCPMCTNLLGALNGNAADIKQRVALKVLGRSPVDRQYAFALERFWASEMTGEMADPGQDPRLAPDIASLWTILDLTPEGRGTDWYPELSYT